MTDQNCDSTLIQKHLYNFVGIAKRAAIISIGLEDKLRFQRLTRTLQQTLNNIKLTKFEFEDALETIQRAEENQS